MGGGVTAAAGFTANGVAAGLKSRGLDLALVVSDRPATVAGVFTANRFSAAPVVYNREIAAAGSARAVIVNSGNANACTGEQGLADVHRTAETVAGALDITKQKIVVSSTGVIGRRLPVVKICDAVAGLVDGLSRDGGGKAAEAIMTTDTVPKETAVHLEIGGVTVTVGGMAKGAGMIAPNMATMLAFITTDAAIESGPLDDALRVAVGRSFNCISVDGDSSTNDTVIVLANGAAGGDAIVSGSAEYDRFSEALDQVCRELALMLVRDGEGATKVIEVHVTGARDGEDARRAARAVAESLLVKTAMFGADANWGRIACAVGYSGAHLDPAGVAVHIGDVEVMRGGEVASYREEDAAAVVKKSEVPIRIELGIGDGEATFWSCDLTYDYVKINADYRT